MYVASVEHDTSSPREKSIKLANVTSKNGNKWIFSRHDVSVLQARHSSSGGG